MFNALVQALLNILFPQKPLVRELESVDPADFASRAEKPDGYAGKDIISCFSYSDKKVRQAIWELKYRGNKRIAALLAAALYDELLAFLEEYAPLTNFTDPLLIPIPLSKKRESERGFNQCRLLADELVRLDSPFVKGSGGIVVDCESPSRGISSSPLQRGELRWGVGEIKCTNFTYCPNALQKVKDTTSQTKADSRKKRLENLKGCFTADANQVLRRNIILIDDVATTGATIDEARRALKAAGARRVIAFTVAH